jgi:hypothetical protein
MLRLRVSAALEQSVSGRINFGDTNLVAPMPGVILQKNVEPGSLVAAGTSAFTLDDTRVVKVHFGVPDSMLAHLKLGAAVPVRVEALLGHAVRRNLDCGSAASLKRCRVVDGMRIVLVNSGDYARDRREGMVELRKQRILDVRNCLCVHLLVMTVLLCLGGGGLVGIVGPLLVVTKKTPVENQVNVFREAVNQPEDLGEACTAFEDH